MFDYAFDENYPCILTLFAKQVTATDPNINMSSQDTEVHSGSYDVILSEYTPGVSMTGSIGGISANSTDGVTITGTGDLSTLYIEVLSGIAGDRGQIIVTDGLASLLNDFLDSFTDDESELAARKNNLENEVKQLDETQERINLRSIVLEKKYYKQWNAVDLIIAKLQNTSSTLTQLLSNIPKLKTK
ncbi:MAG: flagellar filament capping protein FliD [Legionella sp.]